MRVFVAYTRTNASLAHQIQASLHSRGFLVSDGLRYSESIFLSYSFSAPAVAKALAESDALLVLGFGGALKDLFHEIGFFVANSRIDRTVILGTHEDFEGSPGWISEAHKVIVRSRATELIVREVSEEVLDVVCERFKEFPKKVGAENKNIFLSYSRSDADQARRKYDILTSVGCVVWFDEKSLLPGQDWDREVRRAIRSSSLFMALVSSEGLKRRGFFQKELRLARDVIEELPEGDIFILPVLLDPDAQEFLPDWLQRFHWLHWGDDYVSKELLAAISIAQAC